MLFKFKKIHIKKAFPSFITLFFILSALAQTNDSNFFDNNQDEEIIACENLPEALTKYNQNIQLDRYSLKSALSEVSSFLKDASQKKQFARSKLLEMIQNIEKVYQAIQENEMRLSSKGHDIEFFLTECLKRPPVTVD